MLLNVGLAVAVALVVFYTESIWLAIGLVMLSKWRVLAVRPRYWWVNVQSNMVDFIVSVSVVIHLAAVNAAPIVEPQKLALLGLVTLVYILWLLYVKPKGSRAMIVVQGLAAVFLGTTALYSVGFALPVAVTVLGMWMIGFTATRHILASYDNERYVFFLSLATALVYAEIGWIAYHWTVAYALPIFPSLQVPQVAIIMTLLGFVAYKTYDSFYHNAKVRSTDIILPVLLAVSIIAVLVFLFNRVGAAI
jgi:hypothetical protein